MAQGKGFSDHPYDGEMDAPPTLFHTDTYLGQAYIAAMQLAGEYAYAGRNVVVDKVLDILDAESYFEVHNHHNFAWLEEHFGEKLWVVRKGCTPAFPGQGGFVGASMGGTSVILEGVESEKSAEALYSTVHGAGRIMSRTQAAGKIKRTKIYECKDRDCDYYVLARDYKPGKTACLNRQHEGFRRIFIEEVKKQGLIDFDEVQEELKSRGIELRGGAADEAPGVYKNLDEVLKYHEGTIQVNHLLLPVGVAMAGKDTYDPFKD
jgi:tRNA-splicing ligase RtcB